MTPRPAKIRTLLVFASDENLAKLSYNDDWVDAFTRHESLAVSPYNMSATPWALMLPRIVASDVVVLMHSTNSNGFVVPAPVVTALKLRRGRLVVFIGNEYKLMPEKIAFLNAVGADIIASQLPQDTADWLYAECAKSRPLSMPHALNPERFKPEVPHARRSIDIGVRAFEYPWYLGDKERADMLKFFAGSPTLARVKRDISLDPAKRLNRDGWAAFLNTCKGTISTEAGASHLERDDRTRNAVNSYLEANPKATFDEVYEKFFAHYPNPVSGKTISSRHFDAIGTKTCQVMFGGRFSDILVADKHYIELRRDYSNMDEVLDRLLDDRARGQIVDRAHEEILAHHTHRHRINKLISNL